MIQWQWEQLQNVNAWYYYVIVFVAIFLIGQYLLEKTGHKDELPKVDGVLTKKETGFWNSLFFEYFAWGGIQQIFVIWIVSFLAFNPWESFLSALLVFTSLHVPNWRLMQMTAIMGAMLYFGWYIMGYQSIVLVAFCHSMGGTLYGRTGLPMAVWRKI